mmetsp:Transcript_3996/g.4082  ORF Transcript_3996/g.4082 Transcript_3996/m.4082 type:complete len:161 (+) Transcript_3996:243-725(+)
MHTRPRFYATLPVVMSGTESITRQRTSFNELFSFENWQGVGLVRYFYWVGLWVIGLMNLSLLIGGIATGIPTIIIVSVITLPILAVIQLIVLRIVSELMVVLLLLPFYSNRNNGSGNTGIPLTPDHERGIVRIENDQSDSENIDVSIHSKTGDNEMGRLM